MSTVPPHLRPIVQPRLRDRFARPGRGGLVARVCLRMFYRLCLMAAVFSLLALMFLGQTMSAPDWLRAQVAERVNQTVQGYTVDFSDMRLVVRSGWRPRLGLSDVQVTDANGAAILNLSRAEVSLAMRPLLQGKLRPKKITLDGVRAALRRASDGSFSLEYGAEGRIRREAPSLPALIETREGVLLADPWSNLTEFELTSLTLRYDDARSGRGWTVDDGRVLMTRRGDALEVSSSLALLSGRSYATNVDMRYQSSMRSRAAEFGVTVSEMAADDIAAQSPALGWLAPLRAPISGALRGGIDADGALLPVSATLGIGTGVLQPNASARPIPFRSARSYFTFDPKDQVLTFDEISIDSDFGRGEGEGRAYLSGLENGELSDLVGQFTFRNVALDAAGFYPEPLNLGQVDTDFRLKLSPFEFSLGQARIQDAETTLTVDGAVSAGPSGWDVALNGQVGEIELAHLLKLWPEAAAAKARSWVAENIKAGTARDVDWALRGHPGQAPDIYIDFEYDQTELSFLRTMPLLTGASGYGEFSRDRLVVTAETGRVLPDEGGVVDVGGTTFIIPDVQAQPGTPAVVRVQGRGTPTAALSLLNRPPLSVLAASGLPVSLAEGRMSVEGTLALPLQDRVTFQELAFHAQGVAQDVSSSVLAPGHVLTAPELKLTADNNAVEITGAGAISGVPASATWRQPLGPELAEGGRVDGVVELSRAGVETFELGLPDDFVAGTGQGRYALELRPGVDPKLRITSDLDGLALSIPALGWRKSPAATGSFEVEATLSAQPEVTALSLRAAGMSATGRVFTRPGGELDRVVFDRVRLSDWLDVRAELRGRGARTPSVYISGGRFDLNKATLGDSSGGESPPMTVAGLDRLQVTDTIALTGLSGDFTTQGGLSGRFTGRVNGGAQVSGRVVPQAGGSAFEITSTEAGGVFRDAGLIPQARGGDMRLSLVPADQAPGQYDGSLKVTNTRVIDAPAIAALINSISLVGLIDELAGNGIVFSEVSARFRLSAERLILTQSSAIGPSIGLTMDGTYDVTADQLDMQGVLSPFYLLNAVGALVSRRGEGLIGVNFNLLGPSQAPRVIVNPLSALTPGILRDIFRRPTPVVGKNAAGVDQAPSEPPEQKRRQSLGGEDR